MSETNPVSVMQLSEERKRLVFEKFPPYLATSTLWIDAQYDPAERHGLDVWFNRGFLDGKNYPTWSASSLLQGWRGGFYIEEVDAFVRGINAARQSA